MCRGRGWRSFLISRGIEDVRCGSCGGSVAVGEIWWLGGVEVMFFCVQWCT